VQPALCYGHWFWKIICIDLENIFAMLNSISWNQYISFVAVLLAFYYVYIAYKYFRWELLGFAGIKRVDDSAVPIPVEEFKAKLVTESNTDYLPKETGLASLRSFKDELNAYLVGTADSMISKSELLNALQVIAVKYPAINILGNNNNLHQYILAEIEAVHPGIINLDELTVIFSV
jgi:hypothetical protein